MTVSSLAALALLAAGSALVSAPATGAQKEQATVVAAGMAHGKMAAKSSSAGSGAAVSYSPAQAEAGMKAYGANCASCHGANLQGDVGPALSGATLNTLAKNTHLTVGDMFTFISQQMPLNAPASLSKDQYASIMAYILKFNGFSSGKTLTYASASSSKVLMHSKK